MIHLDYDKHINQIKPEDWEKLYAILPQITSEDKFGELVIDKSPKDGVFHFPYYAPSKVIFDFLHIFEELRLDYPEYLGDWEFGKNILQQKEYEFTNLDVTTLCKLLHVIIRTDRFCEGYLIGKFRDGTVKSIIEAIKFQNNITLNWNLEFNKKNVLVKLFSKDNFVIPSKSSIFIYGSPGSGKTELSKNIIISLYKKLESSIVIITESSEYEVFNNFNGIRFIKDKKNLNHLVNILDNIYNDRNLINKNIYIIIEMDWSETILSNDYTIFNNYVKSNIKFFLISQTLRSFALLNSNIINDNFIVIKTDKFFAIKDGLSYQLNYLDDNFISSEYRALSI